MMIEDCPICGGKKCVKANRADELEPKCTECGAGWRVWRHYHQDVDYYRKPPEERSQPAKPKPVQGKLL